MAKAVGVGGVFFKTRDPKALAAWYAKHLGITPSEDGSLVFEGPGSAGMTVFAPFSADTASTTWIPCWRNWQPQACESIPSGKTTPTAVLPGSGILKETGSNSGSRHSSRIS